MALVTPQGIFSLYLEVLQQYQYVAVAMQGAHFDVVAFVGAATTAA